MKYRRVGSSDLTVSEIAFGCGGNAGLMVRGEPAEQTRAVARALELGITYFDNSPDYGNGKAETNLGRALKELKTLPLLNSKVEIRAADLGDIAGHVVRSAEASMTRLGVERLDVLQVHNGPSARPVKLEGAYYAQLPLEHYLRPGGAIEGVRRLLDSGKVRVAGFICRGDDADEVRQVLDTGIVRLINVPYTLLNPTAGMAKPAAFSGKDFGNVISLAQARGSSAAIYAPLAGGFLTDDFLAERPRHPLARAEDPHSDAARKNRAKVAALGFLAEESGLTLAQAAVRFILMNPGVATALGGFSSIAQMEEIAAVSDKPPFPPALMARLESLWAADFK